ncbi:MAG: Cof-type HAD-IIB family hydrolase [Spirochaetaceae bacterium]|jgi:Cof subfamily protein (haloacid dehalogenase superfamily)|nr:Cof-type HAD-IIB family hydrolase [Spirochaetaceae bacterium]
MIKLIVCDLDGTLLDDDHVTVPPANIAALAKARAAGARIVIATGRTHSICTHVLRQIECDYMIISNGAAVFDTASGANIILNEILYETAEQMLALAASFNYIHSVFCGREELMEKRYAEEFRKAIGIDSFASLLLSQIHTVDTLHEGIAGRAVEKIEIFNVPESNKDNFLARARAITLWEISSSYYGKNIELNAPGVTKGAALASFCAKAGIKREEILAFGDSDNDIAMLRWAGNSYAMENALPEVKAAAAYCAGYNTQAGVAAVINQYFC